MSDQLIKEISNKAKELMASWPPARQKQKDFILEYVAGGFDNAAEAARKVGYSTKTARTTASNMLLGLNKYEHIPPVVAHLRDAYNERQEALKIASGAEILQFHSKVMRGELPNHKVVDGIVKQVPAEISDKQKSADSLARMLGHNHENLNINHSGKINPFSELTIEQLTKLADGYD